MASPSKYHARAPGAIIRVVRTIIEPFRIKSVEPLRHTTGEERQHYLEEAGFNLFLIDARHILIDLLTDSGTSAMSTEQWAAVMRGDESYAGGESFFRLKRVADELTGFRHMVPTHQGRAAERILFAVLCKPGDVVPSNTHFDTTRANVESTGARAVDLPIPEARDTQLRLDFKGNMDVAEFEALIEGEGAARIPLVMLTVTNNSGGGQPVSMANIEAVKAVCARYGIPLYLDAPNRIGLVAIPQLTKWNTSFCCPSQAIDMRDAFPDWIPIGVPVVTIISDKLIAFDAAD